MELQLKNIGMIKEANVKIDGLTVIAGENDTGKSTVGRVIYAIIKSLQDDISDKKNSYENVRASKVHDILSGIFKKNILVKNSFIGCCNYFIKNVNGSIYSGYNSSTSSVVSEVKDVVFIESPLIWNFSDFFRDIALIESKMNIEISYPYLMNDLNFKLFIKSTLSGIDMQHKILHLIKGKFKKDEKGNYFFNRDGKRIELVNTATGIKYFGIFQVLSENNWLNKNTFLILDEPEVHLHPKWQLEMAEIIVELVKNGVKVLVNSHSPYMIEALKRYSDIKEQENKTNFYLAEDGYIKQINNSNSETLVEVFEKLSEPFDTFEQMDADSLGKLING